MTKLLASVFMVAFLIGILFYFLQTKDLPNQDNLETSSVRIDNGRHNVSLTPTPVARTFKLLLVGDVMLGRKVNMISLEENNPNYPFEKVADKLRSADLVFANLESPIVYDCPKIESGFTFCGDPKMVDGMLHAGIDIVSIANNHNMNFGKKGYEETKEILTSKGIKWVGDGNLEILEKDGTKYGFLGFDFVTDTMPGPEVFNLVRVSDAKVEVLIVGVHWGNEYKAIANGHQVNWAKQLVEAGADIISGHHPHWVQNHEEVASKKVYYSLGNFVFDQMWSEETKKGMAVELTFANGKIVKEDILSTYMTNWAQPEWVN